MPSPAENYLTTEILGAPPEKLHLALIEAAIRLVQRSRQQWQAGENEAACDGLIRAQQIMTELLSGLNREGAKQIVARLAAVYTYVFRTLVEANLRRSLSLVDDALRVLEVERDTWREVCQKLGGDREQADESPGPALPIAPPEGLPESSFSLEA